MPETAYALAFDTANEVISIGLGRLNAAACAVEPVAAVEVAAHRASNTQLLVRVDALLREAGVERGQLACVCVGRGPGSFTGVRIAMATAKGAAQALGAALVGVSSLDVVAWHAWASGVRGRLAVVADAMRKEVYPVRYALDDAGVHRLEADRVVKAQVATQELVDEASSGAVADALQLTGDGLAKYAELFAPAGALLPEELWAPTGRGLLLALQDAWRTGAADPLDAQRHNPAFLLPVYTRLSDAEENERIRLAKNDPKNLATGVQDAAPRRDQRATMHDTAVLNARPDEHGITYKPLDAAHAEDVAAMESQVMGSDAWNAALVADELPRADRTWWAAYASGEGPDAGPAAGSEGASSARGTVLVGYAGGMVIDGQVQILKIGTDPAWRRRGIARQLISRVASDARDLGAITCSLEVRASNVGAQAFYESLGMHSIGKRPHYYSDREDAVIMEGPLQGVIGSSVVGGAADAKALRAVTEDAGIQESPVDVAGMTLRVDEAHDAQKAAQPAAQLERPLILAIESSCDETAAAIVDGKGNLLSDVVASQIDFHSRFGGVVPEIASRKHIEAICGVCDECLDVAAQRLGMECLTWSDLDGVGVTYAPGLVGALVVGVAFAKGAAWAADKPLVGVNHLEGHMYANKIGAPDFIPPAVVSLVSGGNTMLVHMHGWGDYRVLGATIDDAVGEAFDKVAKALGLGYPGGPIISRYAKDGDPKAIKFPRAMLHSGDLKFSLSGLKTAVVTYIHNQNQKDAPVDIPDLAASFQAAVVDVLVAKTLTACKETGSKVLCIGGGVAANPALREQLSRELGKRGIRVIMPELSDCTDNASMIASAALDLYHEGIFGSLSDDPQAHLPLRTRG